MPAPARNHGRYILRGLPRRPHAVRLDAKALEEDNPNRLRPDAIWIEVAREGTYRGHQSGEFTLDRAVFETVVRNFRNHPSFELGEDGWGVADVIPYDFHHESEKSGGQLAVVGAPAQAWALDLDVRTGADSAVELWALTRYLEPAKSYVAQDKYKWCSVALWPDAVHPKTGESIGWYLSSIAFTNDPFIQGMVPIAASRSHGGALRALEGGALDVDDIMCQLRWIFGLTETAGIADVSAEFAKLAAMATGGAEAPAGVDVGGLVRRLGDLLGLPLLTPVVEVFSAASELLGRLNDATPTQTDNTPAPIAASREESTTMSKLIALARFFALAATITNEDEAVEAIRTEWQRLKLEAEGGNTARSKLSAIGKLFGVEDPDKILDAVSTQHADLETLKAQVPELAEMLAGQADSEEEDAKEEVMEAMRVHRLPPSAQPALEAMRTGGIELTVDRNALKLDRAKAEQLRKDLDGRKGARQRFLAKYPLPPRSSAHLQQSIATVPTFAQGQAPGLFAAAAQAAGTHVQGIPHVPEAAPGAGSGQSINLSAYPGRNVTEQAMAHIRATHPGGDKLPHHVVWQQACELVRSHNAQAFGLH